MAKAASARTTAILAILTLSGCSTTDSRGKSKSAANATEETRGTVAAAEALRLAKGLPGTLAHLDRRRGTPAFLWFSRDNPARSVVEGVDIEAAARGHLSRFAVLYGVSPEESATAVLSNIHDKGRGPIIAEFKQQANGIDVFRQTIRVITNRERELIALSGNLISTESARGIAPSQFALPPQEAATHAIADLTAVNVTATSVRSAGFAQGNFGLWTFDAIPEQLSTSAPVRAKQVYFAEGKTLVPAYYVELHLLVSSARAHGLDYAYVVSATDGRILFRHNLTTSFSYKVWADLRMTTCSSTIRMATASLRIQQGKPNHIHHLSPSNRQCR